MTATNPSHSSAFNKGAGMAVATATAVEGADTALSGNILGSSQRIASSQKTLRGAPATTFDLSPSPAIAAANMATVQKV